MSTSNAVASTSNSTASKYSNVSSSSFLDLKAELNKREDKFAKSRLSGAGSTIIGGVNRTASKKASWLKANRPNKGIEKRQERDKIVYEADVGSTKDPEAVKRHLERKALLYEKIRKGKSGGLSEDQIQSLLVDFDQKNEDDSSEYETDSEEDESATVPVRPDESDPLVDWTDEFGRTRQIPRSEVPRGQPVEVYQEPDDTNVIYGDQRHFPVYEPSPDLLAARKAALAEQSPLEQHYDASADNRVRGAAAYTFSKDEETRKRQMEELKRSREGTEREREKKESGGGVKDEREREKIERKRKIEEKRREMEEKRRKV